jgi:DNA-binding transcriptional LysR family regulator
LEGLTVVDRLESMSILVAAAETGSLSAAARRLGIPLTNVSRKVSELEAYLKTGLVNRSSRRLTLTDAGRSYVADCKRILELVGEAERTATGEYGVPKGDLIITAPIVFGRLHVLPVITDFLKAYPAIDVRLVFADRIVNLFEEQIDIAVRIGNLPDSSLIAARIGTIRHVVCGSPDYFSARGMPETPDELGSHDCITFEGLISPSVWTFTFGKAAKSVPVHSRLIVNTAEAAIIAAISGIGITRVLSYQVAREVRAKRLVLALKDYEPGQWPVSLVYTAQRLLPSKMRVFLDYAVPRLKLTLSADAI